MSSPDAQLSGKIVLVTGGSRGIGAAIAERLASAGAEVVVAARTVTGDPATGTAEATVKRIQERGGRAHAIYLDVTDGASRRDAVENIVERFGRIDILVNNAGTAAYAPTESMPLAEMESQLATYFVGPWHLCSLVIPHMKKAGEGRILNIGSCVVDPPQRPYTEYNAARGYEALYAGIKTGLHRFSLGLAAELEGDNIAVNVLGPVGAVLTPGLLSLNLGLTADNPICEPVEDIAEAAVDILSKPTDFTGEFHLSYRYLDQIGRPSMSLDGLEVVTARTRPELADV